MKEFIDKLIEMLEEKQDEYFHGKSDYEEGKYNAYDEVAQIVNKLAEEYKVSEMPTGWIPCKKDTPKENGWYWGYYVTSSYIDKNGVRHTECRYASIYWEDNLWLYDPRGFRTVDEVIAWKSIAPYTE